MGLPFQAVLLNGPYPVLPGPVEGYSINRESGTADKFLLFKVFVSFYQVGILPPAGKAPCCPEIDKNQLSPEGREGDLYSVGGFKYQVGCTVADIDSHFNAILVIYCCIISQ